MPPKARVPVADAVAILKKYIVHFKERDKFPIYSSIIWKEISRDLANKWTPHNVYVNVKNNRKKILSIACEELGIVFPEEKQNFSIHKSTLEDSETQSADESFELDEKWAGLDEFKIYITANEWISIQGGEVTYKDGRTYNTLRKGVHTSVLADAWINIIYE
ncbi:uncharacterized protein, partial [Fopius arisanus]|uniref:Uncharacterized protein n=1 Tax=Fopius arisanus TaxID=64838 RepID=A0A9R1UA90_9HYME